MCLPSVVPPSSLLVASSAASARRVSPRAFEEIAEGVAKGVGSFQLSTATASPLSPAIGAGHDAAALFMAILSEVAPPDRLRGLYHQYHRHLPPHHPGITAVDTPTTIIRFLIASHAVTNPTDHEAPPLDLRQLNLQGMDLSRLDLSRVDLREANLQRASFKEATLVGANLACSKLMGADLSGADLSHAQLQSVLMIGANMSKARLIGADLTGSDLSKAILTDALLTQATLDRVNLNEATLTGVTLKAATLRHATLEGACVTAGNLCEARLDQANLKGANLMGCDFQGACLEGATLSAVDLRGANLKGVRWNAATDLDKANMSRTDWRGCQFSWNRLESRDGRVRVVVEGPSMRAVDFSGANLSGLDFINLLEKVDHQQRRIRFNGANVENTFFRLGDDYDYNGDRLTALLESVSVAIGLSRLVVKSMPKMGYIKLHGSQKKSGIMLLDVSSEDAASSNRDKVDQKCVEVFYVTPSFLCDLMLRQPAAILSPHLKVAATPDDCRKALLRDAMESWISQSPTASIYLLQVGDALDGISPTILSRVNWEMALQLDDPLTDIPPWAPCTEVPELFHAVLGAYSTLPSARQAQIHRVYGSAPLWPLLTQVTALVSKSDAVKATIQLGCGDMALLDCTDPSPVLLGYPHHKRDEVSYLMSNNRFMALQASDNPLEKKIVSYTRFQVAPEETLVWRIVQLLSYLPDHQRDGFLATLQTHCKASPRSSIVEMLCCGVSWEPVS